MMFQVDMEYLLNTFRVLVETPSPVGFYPLLNPVLEKLAADLGYIITYDRRGTPYLELEGQDNSKTVVIGAHSDTLGLVVRRVEANGTLRVRQLGGINYNNLDGEDVTVHTRDGRAYSGTITCQSHSVHVFENARTMERNENTMMILLDEDVHSKAQVNALGIFNGDTVSIAPRCQVTPNGYLKSRFIDDKAAVACCFTMLKYFREHDLKPKFRTLLAFPYEEEVGLGGTYVPAEAEEYVALDIGLIGPDYDGDEFKVSISAKDAASMYDYDLTNRLIAYAQKAGCDYAVDAYFRYGTDAHAATRGGCNLRPASFGMAVWCSHGRERTHVKGLENTMNLLLAYALDI
jgi:putative aminopeptidase FrvX